MRLFSFGKSIFDKYGIDVIQKVTQILEHEDEVLRLHSQSPHLSQEARDAIEARIEQIHSDMGKAINQLSISQRQFNEIKRYLRKLQNDFERRRYGIFGA